MILPSAALRTATKAAKLAIDEKGIPRLFKQAELPPPGPELPPYDYDAVAARMDTAKLSDYKSSDPWQPNFDKLETTDDIKGLIAEEAQRLAPAIQSSRRGVVPDVELRQLAADLGADGTAIRDVLTRESGGVLKPETIVAARRTVLASAERLKSLAGKINSASATDLEKLQFRHQSEFHKAFFTQFMGARAETGRALRAFGIPVREGMSEAEIRQMSQIADNINGRSTEQLAHMIGQLDTPAQISAALRDTAATKGMNVAQEVFVNSILSGPTTHVVNAGSSALFGMIMSPIERGIAAQVGKFTGGQDKVLVGEATAQVVGMLTGVKDALRIAGHVGRTGMPLDGISRYETSARRALSSDYLEQSGALGKTIDVIGNAIRAPTERVMAPTDAFFKVLAARGELAAQGYRKAFEASMANPDLGEDELMGIVTNFMMAPPKYGMEQAEAAALYSTFQTPLGPQGRKMMSSVNSVPPLRLIMPFVQTPTNIFKAAWAERSPFALFSARIREDIKAGGGRRDLALTRITMGSGTAAIVGLYAAQGKITGYGPSDPKERKLLMDSGWRPYSIVRTDSETGEKTYVSYARAEPIAYIVGATADLMYLRANGLADDPLKDDDQNQINAAAAIVGAISQNTLNKSFLSGMSDFISAVDDPARYMGQWSQNMAGAFVPYSAFRRQLNKVEDPIIREAWTTVDKLRAGSGIPGVSEGLPPRRDVFGEPLRYDQGGSLVSLMAGAMPVAKQDDPVMLELTRVMDESREVPVSMPSRSIEGVRLEAAEYSRLTELSRKELKAAGKNFKGTLLQVITSPMYLEAPTDWARATVLKEVQNKFDDAARKKLVAESPDLQQRIIREQITKGRMQMGEENINRLLKQRGMDQYLETEQ